jgi:hypothetical protein
VGAGAGTGVVNIAIKPIAPDDEGDDDLFMERVL